MKCTKLALAIGGTIVFVGLAGFRHNAEPMPRAARAISALLDYEGSLCSTNCDLGLCELAGTGGHQNFRHRLGNDGGLTHLDCIRLPCQFHNCNPNFTLAPAELNVVVDLLSTLPALQIAILHEAEPNLTLNRGRSAVQVL